MRRTSKLPTTLLPKVPGMKLESAAIGAKAVSFTLTGTSLPATCSICTRKTTRLHSHYGRTVADLPWSGRRVRLFLNVRKFRCPRKGCPRKVFTERLPDLVESYARKTVRLHEILELVGFTLGPHTIPPTTGDPARRFCREHHKWDVKAVDQNPRRAYSGKRGNPSVG